MHSSYNGQSFSHSVYTCSSFSGNEVIYKSINEVDVSFKLFTFQPQRRYSKRQRTNSCSRELLETVNLMPNAELRKFWCRNCTSQFDSNQELQYHLSLCIPPQHCKNAEDKAQLKSNVGISMYPNKLALNHNKSIRTHNVISGILWERYYLCALRTGCLYFSQKY